jgi:hypothetical protein
MLQRKESHESCSSKNPLIRIALVGGDPLQLVGFRAVFHSERDLQLISSSLPDLGTQQNLDLVLLSDRSGQRILRLLAFRSVADPDPF